MEETVGDLHEQFSQNPFGMSPTQNQQMLQQFMKSFATDSLLTDAREAFQQNYSQEYADSINSWLSRASFQKVLEAEKQFYTIQGVRNRVVNRYELEQDPPSESRVQLISTLAQNKSAVETEVESQVIIFRSLITAFSDLSTSQSFSNQQIEGILGNFQSQASQQIHQEVNNQLLLMYHGVEDDSLEEYLQFYDTGAGNWLRETTATSKHAAYQAAGDRFLNAIQDL